MNAVEVRDLHVYYGEKQVLRGVNLDIPERVVFAVMGPSGCGKSTLLRSINRLLELNRDATVRGEIRLFGKNIFEMDPIEVRRRVGMVFQIVNPFPHMSIFDNVALGVRLNRLVRSKEELRERVEWALEKAALWDEVKDRLNEPASRLSGGQQQRLCIARAIALEPEVLLMDEPTANLDPISSAKIEELLYELKEDLTIVMVTHSPAQAARVSDYVAFLYLGEIVEVGETAKIFTNPREELTERYLTGRMG